MIEILYSSLCAKFSLYIFADAAGGRSTQQLKKPGGASGTAASSTSTSSTDSKKTLDDNDDTASNTTASSGNAANNNTTLGSTNISGTPNPVGSNINTGNISKDEDDIYEFKSTPKDTSSSGDDRSDGGKGSDKSSDEKSDDQTPSGQSKRSYSDVESNEDATSVDDDIKRKKRKDTEVVTTGGKDTPSKGITLNRNTPQRQEKTSKISGGPAKNVSLTAKVSAALDSRKSPCPSPKPSVKTNDSDAETDENKSGDSFGSSGPKVPPLKIVIPQQSSGNDAEAGSRNGKNASARSHAALPYVVASSSNSNDSADKESGSSRCTSPSDSAKSVDDKKNSATAMSNEEQRQQRVLRSSHRGGQSVDRGSNNSSPQMQSSSPSPAPVAGSSNESNETTNTATTAKQTTSTTNPTGSSSTSTSGNGNGNGGNGNNSAGSNTSTASPANPSNIAESDTTTNAPSPSASSTSSSTKESAPSTVDLHPRKRKIRASKDDNKQSTSNTNPSSSSSTDNSETVPANEIHPHDQPITNCYQMYLNIRKQIERRQRTLFPVQPKPPQGFKDYLMNRGTYVLAGKTQMEPQVNFPSNIAVAMKELFTQQEKERHKLKMQHVVEKEKLVLAVEQEILRVHGRAARALANQSLPFSVCTILKDEEVYNMITPEQEEKDRNARSRYNGRLFISWLQDVDDKWEKIKVR